MTDDLEIARSASPVPIADVAATLGIKPDELEAYGRYKAKISLAGLTRVFASPRKPSAKLAIVTAITPTRAGEGKTTVTVGLAQALCRLGVNAVPAVRQPSLGPVFGAKGGAAGGGYAQLLPMEDINLHFTGDMHAVTAANNLLSALTDNHVFHGNSLGIDLPALVHRRVLDMNDRALRNTVIGLGGRINGYPRETGFDITAASEVMAILSLSESVAELRDRLGQMVVGRTRQKIPITASELGAAGAMTALLRDAFKPNLVQTLEGTPAFVHGGPFANIAHGCSSVIATRLALKSSDFVITEAGFGSDLGFEKFCDIVAAPRMPELHPDVVVLVATVRALKLHGGASWGDLSQPNPEALERGLANLDRHIQIVSQAKVPFVVAINKFAADRDSELVVVQEHCLNRGWPAEICSVWEQGGEGGLDLAGAVLKAAEAPSDFKPFYDQGSTITDKLAVLAEKVYGASAINLSADAKRHLNWLAEHGFDRLPVCVAKTQYSLSDDPGLLGAPDGFTLVVRELRLSAGAGFVVALLGEVLTMPGLPAHPAALSIDVDTDGNITHLV